MNPETPCVFCSPQIEPWVLWEGNNYRLIADAFPRVPGHVLLITRSHLLHHADAPPVWWTELEGATERMREFLLTTGGAASFWENGYLGKEVPHAHLHGMPVEFPIAPEWVSEGKLLSIKDWIEVRRRRDDADGYTLIIGSAGRYLALDRLFALAAVRQAVIRQTRRTLDPVTGALRRGGAEQVVETRRLWDTWNATVRTCDKYRVIST